MLFVVSRQSKYGAISVLNAAKFRDPKDIATGIEEKAAKRIRSACPIAALSWERVQQGKFAAGAELK